MIRFSSDYCEGAHPAILEALAQTNNAQYGGYGEDEWCTKAAGLIRQQCHAQEAAVHFLVGGTQANLTLIAAALRPHQAALAAATGHIATHETGAIEATGHKVIELPQTDGKISAGQVRQAVEGHWADAAHEHLPQPKLVYLSHPTEYGTLYTTEELTQLYTTCRQLGLFLYIDGARLGYALASPYNQPDLPFIAAHCDAFTIGGTKVGALFGEAMVIPSAPLAADFRYLMKQRGGMLAKGWLLGLQFSVLFQQGLYSSGAAHAIHMATKLAKGFEAKGLPMLMPAQTNQIFPILPDTMLRELEKTTPSPSGRRPTKTTPPCAFAPLGPHRKPTWTLC